MSRLASAPQPHFGHSAVGLRLWRDRVNTALRADASTPFFLFTPEPVVERLGVFEALNFGRPATHWYSTKTQPLEPLLRWWQAQDRPVEVVSETEFRLVHRCGFPIERILVNGPAKHHWLPSISERGLRVNFDSLAELTALLPLAKRHRWQIGLRFCTNEEFDPEWPQFPTQFGLTLDEAASALRRLRKADLEPTIAHFHLRTNLPDATCHRRALAQIAEFCRVTQWTPRVLDIGGGLPPRFTLGRGGQSLAASHNPETYRPFAGVIRTALREFPSVTEIWLENGRALFAECGVLVMKVLDIKERRGLRQLIADGGRTQHALVSLWEQHELLPLKPRRGAKTLTAIYGPTCMAFDQLARKPFPRSVRAGDYLIWFEAGAYHLPWETRFSHDLAQIWWTADLTCRRIR